jgi:hypothetical protein
VLICCLSRRVSKQVRAIQVQGDSKKGIVPKRGTLQTGTVSEHAPNAKSKTRHGDWGGGKYNLVTTLAGLDVADFTHGVQERRGLRIGRGCDEETKGGGGGVAVVRSENWVCVCVRAYVWWFLCVRWPGGA